MAQEEFTIIIKKNGEIVVDMKELGKRTVQNYQQIFEETLGPVRVEPVLSGDEAPPSAVKLSDKERDKDKQKLTGA
jgi:hypothetical protein